MIQLTANFKKFIQHKQNENNSLEQVQPRKRDILVEIYA